VILVELHGLEVFGHHGAGEDERDRGQTFLYDVQLEVRPPAADHIDETVDYREVAACVRDVSDSQRFSLLETLAGAVVDEIAARFSVRRVRVRVRKRDVRPADLAVEWTAATVERP
jgi:dihydroneopterin aldolase